MPANDASRSPGRPRGGDSACRGRLLEAAMEAFARSGYDGASLRAIALAADCDVSMVAHYFGSKAELWRAMVDELAQAAAGTDLDRIKASVNSVQKSCKACHDSFRKAGDV